MQSMLRISFLFKCLLILSTWGLVSSCTINQTSKKTTTHTTYDIFNTDKTNKTEKQQQPVEPFIFISNSDHSELTQLSTWLTSHCTDISINWKSCLNSLHVIKSLNTEKLHSIHGIKDNHVKNFFLAIYHQNQAELLLNQFSDRKHKIQAAHLFIQSKTLLNLDKSPNWLPLREYLIHLIELQLSIMVHQDSFLAVIISPPLLLHTNNTDTHYAMLNWSANALMRKNSKMKHIRKNTPSIEDQSCLISIETAIKFENKLKKKWATAHTKKLDDALYDAKRECSNFEHDNYFFNLVLLTFNQINWAHIPTKGTHPVVTQNHIFNDMSGSSEFIPNYISTHYLDRFIHYYLASNQSNIELDDACFKFNPHYINCYQLLADNDPIQQFKNREFLIEQLTYVFPYELLLHQLSTRLNVLRSELHIEFDERVVMEALFKQQFLSKLMHSDFGQYQLKLLYAYYAIFNLSDVFLNEKDKTIITDYFFTQEGYQLKWELSVIVQDILTLIQHQHFVDDSTIEDKKKPD